MKLGEWLGQNRMTATELASKLGVNPSTVGRWLDEPTEVRPRWDMLAQIARLTNGQVTANDFMGSVAAGGDDCPAGAGRLAERESPPATINDAAE